MVTYSDIQGGRAGEGNIDADPDNGDYLLKSQAGRLDPDSQIWVLDEVTGSSIDAGNPSNPIGSEPLPNGGIVNMGWILRIWNIRHTYWKRLCNISNIE